MSYIIPKRRWYDIIVLNVHAPTKDQIDDMKGSFCDELERVFHKFPKYNIKILLGEFGAKLGKVFRHILIERHNQIDHILINGDLFADSHILNRWRNYFSQLLNVHRVSDVRQIAIHTAEPIVTDPSPFDIEISIANLKRYKSPGSDEIPA
ncbi:hypothetical protein B7P43_G13144 [Cryptotermes secundus]|uniref:Uncharacterized protein n=1 Tax=Cryptotermes secundus TaxID=105785 RepID=A0A2J7PBP6_9NEOP|nr:hypothetical protein B7P43_G13144 [Cryptotermes secundus]